MKFLTLAQDGRSIDSASYRKYESHLDAIETKLPPLLYRMLRFSEQAYRSGRTFYDATIVEWRDVLEVQGWQKRIEIRMLGPSFNDEFQFAFLEPTVLEPSREVLTFRLGQLYCLEVSRLEDRFSFAFMYMTRRQVCIECDEFSFAYRELGNDGSELGILGPVE